MKVLLLTICLLLFSHGCTSKALYNVENEPFPIYNADDRPSLENAEKAILSACKRKGWSPRIIKEGLIEARIYVRSHLAVVEIPFTENEYSIRYKDSENLNYGNGKIHRNYNKWVLFLSQTIQQQFGVNVQKY